MQHKNFSVFFRLIPSLIFKMEILGFLFSLVTASSSSPHFSLILLQIMLKSSLLAFSISIYLFLRSWKILSSPSSLLDSFHLDEGSNVFSTLIIGTFHKQLMGFCFMYGCIFIVNILVVTSDWQLELSPRGVGEGHAWVPLLNRWCWRYA